MTADVRAEPASRFRVAGPADDLDHHLPVLRVAQLPRLLRSRVGTQIEVRGDLEIRALRPLPVYLGRKHARHAEIAKRVPLRIAAGHIPMTSEEEKPVRLEV